MGLPDMTAAPLEVVGGALPVVAVAEAEALEAEADMLMEAEALEAEADMEADMLEAEALEAEADMEAEAEDAAEAEAEAETALPEPPVRAILPE